MTQVKWHCSFYPFSVADLTFYDPLGAGTSQMDSRALTKVFLSVDVCQIIVSMGE